MTPSRLVLRALVYYWRTNAAVALGVATAVAVLAGALVVGDSVRGSLRDLVLQRLGTVDQVVVSSGFFRESLGEALGSHPDFEAAFEGLSPMIMAQALVTEQASGRRVGRVFAYGVDDRFWRLHGVSGFAGPDERDAFVSPVLARELGAEVGQAILVRVQRPSDVGLESLFADKDALGRTLRLTVRAVVPPEALGEFSLQPQQGEVRAVFLPLSRLREELDIEGRVNTLLASARPGVTDASSVLERLVRSEVALEDQGLHVRRLPARDALSVEADGGVLSDRQAEATERVLADAGRSSTAVFTYLANALRVGAREVPYSLVAAVDLSTVGLEPDAAGGAADTSAGLAAGADASSMPIVLNDWTARDLEAAVGDPLTLEYYVWEEPGQLVTRLTQFRVAGIVPINPLDRDMAPTYPGITESATLDEWDPPFRIDLRRVRPVDEEYWQTYRTTPKAYIPLPVGRDIWRSRYGATTSIRTEVGDAESPEGVRDALAAGLRDALDPLAATMAVRDVRAEGLDASRGATDFGEYFVYFSFFLVASALLLAALFFKLSVEQRAREVGLLRAVGARPSRVRGLFMAEGLVLSLLGSLVGLLGAVGYAWLMMSGLRTWWVDAVGTTALTLHLSATSLGAGAAGGVVAAMVCIWATLRGLSAMSERSLLAGQLADDVRRAQPGSRGHRPFALAALGLAIVGIALLGATVAGLVGSTGGFFGAGSALLASGMCLFAFALRRPGGQMLTAQGWAPVGRLGARNATYRPARSVLAVTVVAAATFMLISVDAFRREGAAAGTASQSGVGGYALLVDSLLPIVHDPNARDGRAVLGLDTVEPLNAATFEPFRVLQGDDASCLNLYQPKNPRILAPRDSFLAQGRFRFRASLASTDEERLNPWLLLHRDEPDGAIPVIADANSMTYVLHRALGEDFVITRGERTIRLRLVASLDDTIFQGELLMSQANFLDLFPEQAGSRFLLVEVALDDARAASAAIEDALADFGADATSTGDRLAEFHRVENTYLSTFQALGGLGLVLGTVGLSAVLLRNVLERRRELALLRALGYRPVHFLTMVIAENALLLVSGLVAGTVCALLAIAPVVWERGGQLPVMSLAVLLGSVLAVGLTASAGATAAALRAPLLPALRSE